MVAAGDRRAVLLYTSSSSDMPLPLQNRLTGHIDPFHGGIRPAKISMIDLDQRSIGCFDHFGRGIAADVKHRIGVIAQPVPGHGLQPLPGETLHLGAQRVILARQYGSFAFDGCVFSPESIHLWCVRSSKRPSVANRKCAASGRRAASCASASPWSVTKASRSAVTEAFSRRS